MSFWSALAALFGRSKSKPRPVPVPPPDVVWQTVTIRVFDTDGKPVYHATCRANWEGDAHVITGQSDAFGRWFFNAPVTANVALTVTKDGYKTFPSTGIGATTDVTVKLEADASKGSETGRVRVVGTTFRREDNSIFPWRGFSDFALFARFYKGEDVTPIISERVKLGANVLRVFGMFDEFGIGGAQASGLGRFTPIGTLGYYIKLREFAALVQSRGIRMEFVYFADADARSDGTGGLITERGARQAHIDAVRVALTGMTCVFHELANEAFKNFEDAESYTIDPSLGPRAYGTKLPDGAIPTSWKILDYLTPHDHERKDEWPRTVRGYGEIVDALKVPVVADEPMGFSEVAKPGSRATDPLDAAYFAAGMALFASGSTFHSDDGVASRLLRPVQKTAATAWFTAAQFIPAECQLAPYQRGGAGGGAGVGNVPVIHFDLDEEGQQPAALRTFAKTLGNVAYAVRIRPVGPTVPRDGWKIDTELFPGIAKLTK